MTSNERRRGFTLVELLMSVMLGGLILGSIYQVLVTNQRISAVQRERVLGQQTVRAGLDVLAQELREASSVGGDLLVIDPTQVQFRAPRAFGVGCVVVNNTPPLVTVAFEGTPFEVGDAVYVFADGVPTASADDQWFSQSVTAVANNLTCGTQNLPAQRLTLDGPMAGAQANLIRRGAIVRGWVAVTYGAANVDGEVYLVRTVGAQTARLVGPIDPGRGLEFAYLDQNGDVTAVAANVRRIRVTLRTLTEARDQQGSVVADSLTTSVYLRN